jgi:hypothetical protein
MATSLVVLILTRNTWGILRCNRDYDIAYRVGCFTTQKSRSEEQSHKLCLVGPCFEDRRLNWQLQSSG